MSVPIKEKLLYANCIAELLEVGAIQKCRRSKIQFLSPFFLVPKSSGGYRFILNLRNLNTFLNPPHFKLEDYRTVSKLVFKDCFLCKIDLKDAYYSIAVAKAYRKYLRFSFNNQLFEFKTLPMGLSTAPYVFTKLMKPVVAKLRAQGIVCVVYLDDLLLISSSQLEAVRNTEFTVNFLSSLGFTINTHKSQLVPQRTCEFLGFVYDSDKMIMYLPDKKKLKLSELLTKFLNKSHCRIREFAKLIGTLIAACPVVEYSWVYTKVLEREKILALNKSGSYNGIMRIPESVKPDLLWWLRVIQSGFSKLKSFKFAREIFSDASLSGWGAYCDGEKAHGFWNVTDSCKHINFLELKAAFKALQCFSKDLSNSDILLRIDNVTAVAFINRMGGTQSQELNCMSRKIWQFCEQKGLFLYASYINTKMNGLADGESRTVFPDTEFELNLKYFNKICFNFGVPEIDLFATELNTKCEKYISWKPDPSSVMVDSFTTNWSGWFFYAFPPFCLLTRVLQKIITDRAEGILVVPNWPSQPWFPTFKRLVVNSPLIFKPNKYLLLSPSREPHQLWPQLTLLAACLSGKRFGEEGFQ